VVGGADVDLIVDSCSSQLVVVGEQCGDSCQQTAGRYPKLNPTYTGEQTEIAYVSQTSRLSWARDDVVFPGDGATSSPAPKLHFGVITRNVSHTVQGGTLPGRSVLGLMAPQRNSREGLGLLGSDDRRDFVHQVFGANGVFRDAAYSIAIDPEGDAGSLVLGGVHLGLKGWVPLVPYYDSAETAYLRQSPQWVIRIRRAVAVAHDGRVLVTLPFTYCRFDTGNTWLSVPSKTFTEHGHLGELPGIAGLQFVLDNGVHLWIPAPLFSGSVAMANATGFGGLAEDRSLRANWLIFGNEIMRGMTVACDLARGRLGLGGMCVHTKPWADCGLYEPPEVDWEGTSLRQHGGETAPGD